MPLMEPSKAADIEYRIRQPVASSSINRLREAAWPEVGAQDWDAVLARSLGWVCAYDRERLVGFVNVAWDGGSHTFLLDTAVHPSVQGQGIGLQLVRRAADLARASGADWLHVDYEPKLRRFYQRCGFQPTEAGLLDLSIWSA